MFGASGLQFGVGHPASATVFRLLSLFPAALFPFCAGVPAIGVGQPARFAMSFSVTCTFLPSGVLPDAVVPGGGVCPPLGSVGVGHPANQANAASDSGFPLGCSSLPAKNSADPDALFQSLVAGVGHEPEALSDMGRADARSAKINRPAGVARSFQVSLYKVEPTEAVKACNLLAKNDCRATLLDEIVPGWP
jgi:hypothetical protein